MEVAKKDLTEYLNTPYNTYKKWSEDKLKRELLKNCWEVISIGRQGRSVIYNLKYVERDFDVEEYVESEFNVRNGEDFMNYTKTKLDCIENNLPMSRTDICNRTKTNVRTARRYEEKLEAKEVIIDQDEYIYIKKEGDASTVVTEEEYKHFWRENFAVRIAFEQLEKRVEDKEITMKEYNYLYEQLRQRYDLYYFKIRKYLINETNPIYKIIKPYLN